ncbi:MAG: hypothetical protein OIF57_04585 [Marinobacterium sp.]|nr:hypothetical protein [Marinobacterium sp.]
MSTENNVHTMPVPDKDGESPPAYSDSYIATFVGHVPLMAWCEFERCTVNAIDTRLSKGIWQAGVHVIKPEGGKRMVNLKAAKRWLEGKRSRRG